MRGRYLVEFCEANKLLLTNTCFKHHARHITTWSQTRIKKEDQSIVTIYNQIDYILCSQSNKATLKDARSYNGTEVSSDHRIVVTRIEMEWRRMFNTAKKQPMEPVYDVAKLVENEEVRCTNFKFHKSFKALVIHTRNQTPYKSSTNIVGKL